MNEGVLIVFVKFIKLIIWIFLVAIFSISCTFQKEKHILRLGFIPNVTHATALIGIEKNIFQNELGNNIKFTPVHFVIGNSIIDAFITNQIDAAYIGPGPFINALYRNIPVKLLANAANSGTTIVGVKAIHELPPGNLRIAVPQYGNTQDLLLRAYLKENNLSDKVKIIAIPPQDTGTAFFTMSIDGACLPEPWGTILIEKNICKLLVDEKSILNNGNYPATLLVVNKKFDLENPELIKKLLTAHKKATEFIANNPLEAVKVTTNAISGISKKEINQSIIAKAFKRCTFNNDLDLNILKEFKIIAIIAGYYRKDFSDKIHENSVN
ncbi:MAG: hypothetical protein A3I68_07680 [Candidatus Melainabacteria bacterium RIFCSPLOWO2_02_FULL_35_15]|nr:MAG: hypothetical protein A3F80_02845 [Candidatus Melainabacteria bacterium RIFCSPLOWO2_12_FULL_35_11]OGI14175.1 MAG: hypothetical protein A3I68_07680 [Candidatus Melainabacteria bacterium RIFCSPLOWO2_02_FULL_35_15]